MIETPSVHACAEYISKYLYDHVEQLIAEWHELPSGPARNALQVRIGLLRIWESAMDTIAESCGELPYLDAKDPLVQDVYAARLDYLRDHSKVFTLSPELAGYVGSIPEQERQRGLLHAQILATHPKLQRKSAKAKKNVQQFLDGVPDRYEQLAMPVLAFLNIEQQIAEARQVLEQRGDMRQVDILLGPWGSIPRTCHPPLSWY